MGNHTASYKEGGVTTALNKMLRSRMNAAIPPDHAFHTNNFKIYTSVTYIQSQISQTLELSE